ncbi:cupin domain-containing protein [Frankia sp. AgB1.9]|uniref:cupin domain-containing protein n=1 Tax=unclassified Frankia TaxID=2632575 RepID=UPI0019336433|nr:MULTISPECIES: cupin domain-containing protein [unclassified Frankia]MBL7488240.1 cupin domain-containing protein [Frankia sp. AgW1.1]MBL7548117.1 cupin domain-containing protein [Frankia sp. AgB1.9]MBL7620343.1 cupin domain-containing protein [Frankia sp. AgB1.8]
MTGTPEPQAGHSNEGVPGDGAKMFFFDSNTLPYRSNEEVAHLLPEDQRDEFLDSVGRDLVSTTILYSPTMTVVRSRVGPGALVRPHRHGTNQLTYLLAGELRYGRRVTRAGQGVFSPNQKYTWVAGPEGAEWIEIHDGHPKAYQLD